MLISRCSQRLLRLVLIVLCVIATSESLLSSNERVQNHPAGARKVGRIANAPFGTMVPGSQTLSYTVVAQVQTFIDAWVEYNPTTWRVAHALAVDSCMSHLC